MYQPGSPGAPALFVIVVLSTAIATISNVVPIQGKEVKSMSQDYVNGLLSLKSSLQTKRPSAGYSCGQQEEPRKYPNQQEAAWDKIGSHIEYMPQLQDQNFEQKQPKIQAENNANLEQSWLTDRPLAQSQMLSLPSSSKLSFMNPHVGQSSLVQSPVPKQSKLLPQQPTTEQLQLLQQMSEFFKQRQQMQRPGIKAKQTGQNEGQDDCDSESPDECDSKTTKKPENCENEESVTVIVKPQATPKPTAAPETSTVKPPRPTKGPTKSTKHKSTTKKLPCCTKAPRLQVVEAPSIVNIAPNLQNDLEAESQSLVQLPRIHRNMIHPELMMKAYEDLVKYNEFLANKELEDPGLQHNSRVEPGSAKTEDKKLRPPRMLDNNKGPEIKAKLWSDIIKSRQKGNHSNAIITPISQIKDKGQQERVIRDSNMAADEPLRPSRTLTKEEVLQAKVKVWADMARQRKKIKDATNPSLIPVIKVQEQLQTAVPKSEIKDQDTKLDVRVKRNSSKELLQAVDRNKVLLAEADLYAEVRRAQRRAQKVASIPIPHSDHKEQEPQPESRVKRNTNNATYEYLKTRPVLSKEQALEAKVKVWTDLAKYRKQIQAAPYPSPLTNIKYEPQLDAASKSDIKDQKQLPIAAPNSDLKNKDMKLDGRARRNSYKDILDGVDRNKVLLAEADLYAEVRRAQRRAQNAAAIPSPTSHSKNKELQLESRVKRNTNKAADEYFKTHPVLSREQLLEAELKVWTDLAKYREQMKATPSANPISDIKDQIANSKAGIKKPEQTPIAAPNLEVKNKDMKLDSRARRNAYKEILNGVDRNKVLLAEADLYAEVRRAQRRVQKAAHTPRPVAEVKHPLPQLKNQGLQLGSRVKRDLDIVAEEHPKINQLLSEEEKGEAELNVCSGCCKISRRNLGSSLF